MNANRNLRPLSKVFRFVTILTLVLTNFAGIIPTQSVNAQSTIITIWDSPTGGDCASYGVWDDGTKTCQLTTDIYDQWIEIAGDNLTLDGNGHLLSAGPNARLYGVRLQYRTNVTVRNMRLENFGYGIHLDRSSQNLITQNQVSTPSASQSIWLYESYENTVSDNSTSGEIQIGRSYNNLIVNNTVTNSLGSPGIRLASGHHNVVKNNQVSGATWYGIYVVLENYSSILENDVFNNSSGIELYANSTHNTVERNSVHNNGAGIDLTSGSSQNTVVDNQIISNTAGMNINGGSNDNVVTGNTIQDNSSRGMQIDNSSNNQVYNNNFINNNRPYPWFTQLVLYGVSGGVFDKPAPIGGNYWSDHDEPSEGCSDTNLDAFCDTPYVLQSGFQDNLPWARATGWVNHAPVADAGGPYTATVNQPIMLDASASSDPDGHSLAYHWDLDNDGEYDDLGGMTPQYTFSQTGEFTIGLYVFDVFGLTSTDTTTVNVVEPVSNPTIVVRPWQDFVHGWDWPDGAWVTLTLNHPDTPQDLDYTETNQASYSAPWSPQNTLVSFVNGALDIKAGDIVTMTDGVTTKTHITTDLTVDEFDINADTISGTAEPGSEVINGNVCDDTACSQRTVTADSSGHWTTDFSIPGDTNHPETIDIRPATEGIAIQNDEDGDSTHIGWSAPNPSISVRTNEDRVEGQEWTLGSTITVTVDDPVTNLTPDISRTAIVYEASWNPGEYRFDIDLKREYDIKPGDIVTASDDSTTKTHVVTSLVFTEINIDTDIVTGMAEPGSLVDVWTCDGSGCYNLPTVTANNNGVWTANFTGTDDIVRGTWVDSSQHDQDGDATFFGENVPNPTVSVRANEDRIEGQQWTLDSTITVTVDDPVSVASPDVTKTAVVYEADWNPGEYRFDVDLNGEYDIKPGDIVTATEGTITKVLEVADYAITDVNLDTDIVSGTAQPGQHVNVWTCRENEPCVHRDPTADSNGNWSANFGVPGDQQGESQTADLQAGSWVDSSVDDEDGDSTMFGWSVPNPTLSARLTDNEVHGYTWSLGASILLTIDDPTTPELVDHSDTRTAVVADWNPNETIVVFPLWEDGFNLQPGMTVTMTDGITTRTHVVIDLFVTEINAGADTISGHGNPNQDVWVDIWCENCPSRHVTADSNGDWIVDFSSPGDEDWENNTFDIQPGNNGEARQQDIEGNATAIQWKLYTYTLHAVPTHPEVHGHDWRDGSDITLIVDNDTDLTNGTLYERTKNADDDPWCGYPCFDLAGVFELQVGQYVTMTDGTNTKTVQVSTLQITEVSRETDTISGIADPGSRVAVNIWSQDGKARYVTADENGNWTADFSVIGDEDFEQFTTDLTYGDNGRAIQLNPDDTDDGTLEYWGIDWVAPDWIPLVSALAYSPDLNHLSYDLDTWTLANLLWQPLFRSTGQNALMPASATGYVLSADGLSYTITLRDDMYWSDGQPVTAQHFVDGLLRILAPDTASDYYTLLYDIAGADDYHEGTVTDPDAVGLVALDDHTMQIILAHPAVHFPQVLAIPGMVPVRLDLIDQFGEAWVEPGNFVGNGPYVLIEKDNGHILLQKNPYYYDAANLAFDYIAFDIIGDTNEQFNAYQRGEIDVVIDAPQGALADPNYESEQFVTDFPGIISLGLNVQDSPTDNLLVRKALAASIDRRYILDNVLNTPWMQEATGIITPELPGYQGTDVGYSYNPLIAQNLLAQAGYPNGEGLPTIHIYGRSFHETVLEAVADQWRSVLGVTVEVHLADDIVGPLNQCQDDPNCDYQAYRLGWVVDYFDAHSLLNDFFHPDSGFQPYGWDSTLYRNLITLSMAERDPAQRIAYLQEAEQILVEDDAVIIPLHFTSRISLIKPGFVPVYGLPPYFDLWNFNPPNQPPAITSLAATVDPIQIGGSITATATFTDPDAGDTHTVLWDWGDGTTSTLPATATTVTALHSYTTSGVYTVTLTITDADGASDTESFHYVVVYDPNGGFVTGGGWINSPYGALRLQNGLPFFNGSYYKFVDHPSIAWADANDAANASALDGCGYAHLVTITSQEEQNALIAFFDGALQGKWYGGFQAPEEADPYEGWNWVTGELWNYTNWAQGEPNDVNGPGSEQHLIGWEDGWSWNDEGNLENVTGYVVEYEQCGPTGKATFGFVSKYQKGATVPTGNTEFQFQVANLNFKSTSYEWLVIAGTKAQYKGTGTINGAGEYGFMLTAIDGSPDKFRIKIWDKATGAVIYDNQLGATDTDDPTTIIQGGSIVIHKVK